MGFIQKQLDIKRLARAFRKRPEDPEWESRFLGAATVKDLTPEMLKVFVRIMRYGDILLSEVNFDEICCEDFDDLESVLGDNPSFGLFRISETFREFAPSAPDKRVFI